MTAVSSTRPSGRVWLSQARWFGRTESSKRPIAVAQIVARSVVLSTSRVSHFPSIVRPDYVARRRADASNPQGFTQPVNVCEMAVAGSVSPVCEPNSACSYPQAATACRVEVNTQPAYIGRLAAGGAARPGEPVEV